MVEVGTTNRTHLRDYENAITEDTAAILRVHPSNYRIDGFSSEVPLADLAELTRRRGLVLIDDVGAGSLIDFSRFGFGREPTLPDSIRTGADLTTSSADKLIGGPQGGIILGRRDLIDRARQNPLARALRVDKITLAALEETLTLWLDEDLAIDEIAVLRMLRRDPASLGEQAERIAAAVEEGAPEAASRVAVTDGYSQMGSGSLPGQNLPTRLVAIEPGDASADALARALRMQDMPIFTRIQDDRVLIDPRTLLPGEEPHLVAGIVAALKSVG
jgi:L-seryl-tRNA(Ser) seleniumtransferase